jgi:hypothetical protein
MRVLDILLEFAPTTPEEDERRLASFPGQPAPEETEDPTVDAQPPVTPEPTSVVAPAPAPVPNQAATQATPAPTSVQPAVVAPAPSAPAEEKAPILAGVVSSKLKKLVADANSLPDWEPVKRLVANLVRTLTSSNVLNEGSKSLDISPEELAIAIKNINYLVTQKLMTLDSTVDVAALATKMVRNAKAEYKALEKKYVLKAEEITNSMMDILKDLANKVQGYTSIDDDTYKALNKAEKKIHDNARNFAAVFQQALFGMIMRMLRQNKEVDRNKVISFLEACHQGKVIDMEALISKDSGNVKDHVVGFQDMLDLFSSYGVFSWSPGKSSGAIGPGEMALAMMGSPTQKAQHGGDLIINDVNLEIKAGATSGGRLNSKKILKGPAAWPVWTQKISNIIRKAPARKLKPGTEIGVRTDKSGHEEVMTKENYTPNTYKKNSKGHYKEGCVYNWSSGMLKDLNNNILIYSDKNKTYDLFYSTISTLITNLDEVAEPMMVKASKGKDVPKLTPNGKIAFPGVDAERLIWDACLDDGTIDVQAMMQAYTKLAYASYNRADGVEAIMFLNTETLDYTIAKNGDELASKMLGNPTLKISGGFNFNDDQQSATPAYLAVANSPKIVKR